MVKSEPLDPPDLADKLRRLVWSLAWACLCRCSPIPLHGWRRFVLRRFGARIGAKCRIYPSATIWAPWNLQAGEGCCIGPRADIYNVAPVRLGRWSVVSQKAYLCSAGHDVRAAGFVRTGAPIELGDHAWVAAAAFVGPGVSLGEGAVAGACAVVTRDVPPRVIVGGNPARPIGIVGEAFAGGLAAPARLRDAA